MCDVQITVAQPCVRFEPRLRAGDIEADALGFFLFKDKIDCQAECRTIVKFYIVSGFTGAWLHVLGEVVGRNDLEVRVKLVAGQQCYIGGKCR